MNYIELLKNKAEKYGSIVCMGMDPVLENIPIKGKSVKETIVEFYEAILNSLCKKGIYPSAVKPNYAFYGQYGLDGIEALWSIIKIYKREGLPVILDVKRGDIGTTAEAYAREAFVFFEADAVTLAPYMGYDSISPFMNGFPDKGYYVLNKTSNKSSVDFQDIMIDGSPFYSQVTQKIIEWYRPGIGAVVGATYPEELRSIIQKYNATGKEFPLLIPGVGRQGGDVREIVNILKENGNYQIHRINSSSAINYAYKKSPGMDYAEAAAHELHQLNEQIAVYLQSR